MQGKSVDLGGRRIIKKKKPTNKRDQKTNANKQQNLLEPGDVEEGLRAAASIGDDTIQSRAGRRVNVEAFTHGSSAQRVKWLKRGMQTGSYDSCNTFSEGA